MSAFVVRPMRTEDAEEAAALQVLAFPPPFPSDLLWQPAHLIRHLYLFPEGQFLAICGERIVGSCSNTRITEERWNAHSSWDATVGGPLLNTYDPQGSTMYGLDITVHPDFRRLGVGRAFYEARFALVRKLSLMRYGTAVRMPGYHLSTAASPTSYAQSVVNGDEQDPTLTPLLRYNLAFLGVIEDYMEDRESGNSAALLEWRP